VSFQKRQSTKDTHESTDGEQPQERGLAFRNPNDPTLMQGAARRRDQEDSGEKVRDLPRRGVRNSQLHILTDIQSLFGVENQNPPRVPLPSLRPVYECHWCSGRHL